MIHDLIFDKVLDLLNVDCAVEIARQPRHLVRDERNLLLRQAVGLTDFVVCLADGVLDLFQIEINFRTVSLDDLHTLLPSSFPLVIGCDPQNAGTLLSYYILCNLSTPHANILGKNFCRPQYLVVGR